MGCRASITLTCVIAGLAMSLAGYFGLLAGRNDLVARIRVKGFELGMEARQMLYPAVVRTLEQKIDGRREPPDQSARSGYNRRRPRR